MSPFSASRLRRWLSSSSRRPPRGDGAPTQKTEIETDRPRLPARQSGGAGGGDQGAAAAREQEEAATAQTKAIKKSGELHLHVRRTRWCSATRRAPITLVEFFDYNCGYCKRALTDMNALLDANPDLQRRAEGIPHPLGRIGGGGADFRRREGYRARPLPRLPSGASLAARARPMTPRRSTSPATSASTRRR